MSFLERNEPYFTEETVIPGMVVQADNPSAQNTEAGGSPVQGLTGLHGKTLSQKTSERKERREGGRSG